MKFNVLFFCVGLAACVAFSQKSSVFSNPDKTYQTALELFSKQQYASAQKIFDKLVDFENPVYNDVSTDAEYYAAICALELFNPDAEYRIGRFIIRHPESPRVKMAHFQMGKYQYRDKNFHDAIYWFEKVNKYDLSSEELSEYYFKMAHSYFSAGNTEKANKIFYELTDKENKYSSPALYYYSHIEYVNKNYETALNGFQKLRKDATFSVVVPYYLAHIYYQQKKYDEVIRYVPGILDSVSGKRAPELTRIVGESYYRTGNYLPALKYLTLYKQKSPNYIRDDMFQLAYVYFKLDSCNKAIELFQLVTNAPDLLGQTSFYHIAACYLKIGNKQNAMHAFASAGQTDFDLKIKESSLFNYAKLSFELSYSPFNETLNAFHQFLELFPNSIHKDEVYDLLIKVYLVSKNYGQAIESIERIKDKNPKINEAFQRVTYYRALELFNNLELENSLVFFDKSLTAGVYNPSLKALTIYWKAEALYKLGRNLEAAALFEEFLITPGAYALHEYQNSYYNLGYAYFKDKAYPQAINAFRKYSENPVGKPVNKVCDAHLRSGDSYYVTRNFNSAVEFYNRAVATNAFDQDYALFQASLSYGILKEYFNKINSLQKLLGIAQSNFHDNALFEMAGAYFSIDSVELAILTYNKLIQDFPNSIFVIKALPQLGQIYYNKGDYTQALIAFKKVVSDYPGTPEAVSSLVGIKNSYTELKDVDAYVAYLKLAGIEINLSLQQQDSLTYLVAEKAYFAREYEKSVSLFIKYLQSFSDGAFALSSRYYLAESYSETKDFEKALSQYQIIIEKPKNIYTEISLLHASRICFTNNWFEKAYNFYFMIGQQAELSANILEGRIGLMRSAFKLKWHDKAIDAAGKLMLNEKLPPEMFREVHLVLAESYYAQGKLDFALAEYRVIANDINNEFGSKARIRVFEILLEQKKTDEAQADIMHFISENPPFAYYLAKSFLLLSDIHYLKNDLFSAKTTLLSVMDNYENTSDEILSTAKEKLNTIMEKENKQFRQVEQSPLEVEMKDK